MQVDFNLGLIMVTADGMSEVVIRTMSKVGCSELVRIAKPDTHSKCLMTASSSYVILQSDKSIQVKFMKW
jgi:hypothetical protein